MGVSYEMAMILSMAAWLITVRMMPSCSNSVKRFLLSELGHPFGHLGGVAAAAAFELEAATRSLRTFSNFSSKISTSLSLSPRILLKLRHARRLFP